MSDEDIIDFRENESFDDPFVNHLIVHNSSIWVIGPYIPEDVEGNAMKNWLHYHIAAAVMF